MGVRSLTQVEAERRAALLAVERYDIAVDLTDLPTGPEVRCVSTVTFTCREPGRRDVRGLRRRRRGGHASTASPLAPADGRPHRAGRPGRATTRCVVEIGAGRTRPTARACTGPSTRPTRRSTSGCPSSRTRPATSGPASTSPTSRHRTRSRSPRPAAWTVRRATPATRSSSRAVGGRPPLDVPRHAAAVDVQPGRQRRAVPRDPPRGRRPRPRPVSPGGRWPAVLERDADEIFTLTGQGLALLRRASSAMPFPQRKYDQVFMPEFGGAMENYGCVTWSDVVPAPVDADPGRAGAARQGAAARDGAHVVRQHRHDALVGRPVAQRGVRRVRLPTGPPSRATAYTDAWAGSPRRRQARRPTWPTRARRRTRSASRSATSREAAVDLRRDHLSQGRLGAAPAHGVRRRADVRGRHDGVLRPARLGQHHPAGPDRRARRGQRARPRRLARRLAGDGRHRPAHASNATATASCSSPRGPTATPRPQVLASAPTGATADGLERRRSPSVEVARTAHAGRAAAGADLYLVNDDDLTFATHPPRRRQPRTRCSSRRRRCPPPSPAASRWPRCGTCWSPARPPPPRRALRSPACCAAETVRLGGRALPQPRRRRRRAVVARRRARRACRARWPTPAGTLAGRPDRRQVALRGLARTAGDLDEVAWLLAQAGDDVDLQWRAWSRKAELGGETDGRGRRACCERDPDPEAWIRALAVRAATPDAGREGGGLAGSWPWTAACRSAPWARWRTAFWRPGQDELLRRTPSATSSWCPTCNRGGMIPAAVYTYQLFPLFGIDRGFLDRAEAAVGSHPGRPQDPDGAVRPVAAHAARPRLADPRARVSGGGRGGRRPGRGRRRPRPTTVASRRAPPSPAGSRPPGSGTPARPAARRSCGAGRTPTSRSRGRSARDPGIPPGDRDGAGAARLGHQRRPVRQAHHGRGDAPNHVTDSGETRASSGFWTTTAQA